MTNRWKCLQLIGCKKLIVKAILLLLCLILACGTINSQSYEINTVSPLRRRYPPGRCSTRPCSDAVRNILLGLDKKVAPCQNFYKHVCGNFEKNVELANGVPQANKYSILMDKIMDQITYLVRDDVNPNEPATYKLIKNYYHSCLNETFIESQGLEPLDRVSSNLGGWPVILGDSWILGENFSWEHTDSLLLKLGFTPKYIHQPYVMKDMKIPTKNILYLKPLETKIESLEHDKKLLQAYRDYMVDIAVMVGADRSRAIREMNETFNLEYNLFKARNTQSSTEKPEKDKLTIGELKTLQPSVSWLKYLNDITAPLSFLKDSDEVQLENPMYLRGVEEVLRKTNKRTIANYIIWRAIDESVEYLSDQIHNRKRQFDKVITGSTSTVTSRGQVCIRKMLQREEGLLPGVSAMYIKAYFHDDAKNKVASMVSDFHNYYKEILEKNSWLEPVTKQRALKKLEVMKNIIGYPQEISDLNFVDKYYENVRLTPNNYFENARRLKKAVYLSSINDLKKTPEESCWLEFALAASVNVHFNRIYNAIVLPAAVLQPPFFDKNQPNYINYGSMGLFIGHELTHAFTFEDLPLDENGSNTRWWSDSDQFEDGQKSACFIDHYDNFTTDSDDDDEHESIGTVSLNENLADNEGFRVAGNAYRIWKRKNGEEQLLPSLAKTNEQLFWISAASTLCTKRTEENKKMQRATDEHASEEIRVNGAVANSADFSKAFHCPLGSPMNPQQKCNFF